MGTVIVVTSGKGGVGKTTSTAALGAALAASGDSVAVVDFDVGLRNLDLVMGAERRVVFDFINVVQGQAKLAQAMIRDKRLPNLFLLPASQTRDKDALTEDGVRRVMDALRASFDWVMSGLRALPEVWSHVELPVERQRRVGWNVLSRVAEQQLGLERSCVLDLVAREEPRAEWEQLAAAHRARFAVIECVCSDEAVHRERVEGRRRGIPGWYELDWDRVAAGRRRYEPLAEPKVVIDAVEPLESNLARVRAWLETVD